MREWYEGSEAADANARQALEAALRNLLPSVMHIIILMAPEAFTNSVKSQVLHQTSTIFTHSTTLSRCRVYYGWHHQVGLDARAVFHRCCTPNTSHGHPYIDTVPVNWTSPSTTAMHERSDSEMTKYGPVLACAVGCNGYAAKSSDEVRMKSTRFGVHTPERKVANL